MRRDLIRYSKLMSFILRHDPGAFDLTMDDAGWVGVDALITAMRTRHTAMDRALLEEVVATNDKRRFVISPDGSRIRAVQGHSVGVDLGLPATEPPEHLYHGTAARFLDAIRAEGLRAGNRDHVHLSLDVATAKAVGSRHGRPVVLVVEAGRMHRDGHTFHLAENGVWLTAHVPAGYLRPVD